MATAATPKMVNVTAKPRDNAQDIAKGISILIVLQVHIFQYPQWYQIIMALTGVWLMAFFFVLSGYYYHPGARKPKESIKRRATQLMKPYLLYSLGVWVITTVYNLIHHAYTFKECVRQYLVLLFSRNTFVMLGLEPKQMQMTPAPENSLSFSGATGPFWFVIMMFFAYIFFFLIADYALSNMKRFLSIVLGLVFLTFGLNLIVDKTGFSFPWNFQNVPMAVALILVGAMLGQHKVLSAGFTKPKWMVINSLVTAVIILLLEWQYRGIGSFSAGRFMYYGAVEVFACMLFGTMGPFMIVSFARLVEKIPVINKALIWVGLRTLPLLLTHMLISALIVEFIGIRKRTMGAADPLPAGETLLNFVLTLVIFVLYRLAWEFILKKIKEKKAAKQVE